MKKLMSVWMVAIVFALTSCGGGGGSTDTTNKTTQTPASTLVQIVGTAATGAALTFANVEITSTDGSSPCVETDIKTDGLGAYKCTMKVGKTAPFFIVVTDPAGNTAPLVSIATVTPTAGTPLTVNATPLTTAIVGQLNGGDALSVVSDKTKYSADKLNTIKANVLAQIKAILTSIGAPTDYDPFTTSITAATAGQTGNTADQVLDVIKIARTSDMKLALSTIADPTPIQMATDTAQGSSVAAPPTSIGDLSKGAFALAQAFNTCYALDVSKRVTKNNNKITYIAPECKNIVIVADNPKDAPDFKNNGMNYAEVFYDLLNSESMKGAIFSVPEIVAYYPSGDGNSRDSAALNIRYVDRDGFSGNKILMAQKFTAAGALSSNWVLTGNQWNYDISVYPLTNKKTDWLNSANSAFQTGMEFDIRGTDSAPLSSTFDSVWVTGKGLPANGLWYVRSSSGYTWRFVVAQNRLPPPQRINSLNPVCVDCDWYWFSRTNGIKDSLASSLRVNPIGAFNFSQSSDGGYDGTLEAKRPIKGDKYEFSIYKDGVLVAKESRSLLTDITSATKMQYLAWHDDGKSTIAAFQDSALSGAQTSLTVDWIKNPNAEPIEFVSISQADGNDNNATKFALGSLSVTATPVGTNNFFTARVGPVKRTGFPQSGYRYIYFRYKTTDGSKKIMDNYYYP